MGTKSGGLEVEMWEEDERRLETKLGGDVEEGDCPSLFLLVRTSFSEAERLSWASSSRRCRCCRFAT